MLSPALDVGDSPPGVALVPGSIQCFGGDAELDKTFLDATPLAREKMIAA
jgi:hypothetical protein